MPREAGLHLEALCQNSCTGSQYTTGSYSHCCWRLQLRQPCGGGQGGCRNHCEWCGADWRTTDQQGLTGGCGGGAGCLHSENCWFIHAQNLQPGIRKASAWHGVQGALLSRARSTIIQNKNGSAVYSFQRTCGFHDWMTQYISCMSCRCFDCAE